MRKSVLIIAVLMLAAAAFGFGCDRAGELSELADQAGELKESFDQLKESATNLQSEIESQLPATPTTPAEIDETAAPPAEPGTKIITVWLRDDIRNATIGGHALEYGIDNRVEINPDEPLVAEWDYTDSYGRDGHANVDLDSYYSYFVLRELGGWSASAYESAYENDKVSGLRD